MSLDEPRVLASTKLMWQLDSAHLGWASACAPHKPLREAYDIKVYPDLNAVWQETDKSFIWDHTL